jgi:hypothetical protein
MKRIFATVHPKKTSNLVQIRKNCASTNSRLTPNKIRLDSRLPLDSARDKRGNDKPKKTSKATFSTFAIVAMFVLGFMCASCFLGGQGPNHPKGPGHYETAWVDPELIVSDSLITLIRSDRVDKAFVTDKEKRLGENQPSLEFVITQEFCTVEVNMVGSKSVLVEPLFSGTLRPGNYKLTVDPSRIDPDLKRQKLSIKADFCGRKKSFDIAVSRL